jgi:hypothetical protein
MLCNFTLEYAIRIVQRLELNGTYQFLVYAKYVNLLGAGIRRTKGL